MQRQQAWQSIEDRPKERPVEMVMLEVEEHEVEESGDGWKDANGVCIWFEVLGWSSTSNDLAYDVVLKGDMC